MCDASLPIRSDSRGELSYACPICGYELIGLDQQRCSECGALVSRHDAIVAWMISLGVVLAPQHFGGGALSYRISPVRCANNHYWIPREYFYTASSLLLGLGSVVASFFVFSYALSLATFGILFVYFAGRNSRSSPVISYRLSSHSWHRHSLLPVSRFRDPIALRDSFLFLHSSRQVGFANDGFGCTLVVGDSCMLVCASDRAEDIRAYLDKLPEEIVQRSVSSSPEFRTLAWSEDSLPSK